MRHYDDYLGNGQFKRITIPLVRRIYPQLIADKLIKVQPLTGPTCLPYYLKYKHSRPKHTGMKTYDQWVKEHTDV
jgi:hypothetical protein